MTRSIGDLSTYLGEARRELVRRDEVALPDSLPYGIGDDFGLVGGDTLVGELLRDSLRVKHTSTSSKSLRLLCWLGS